MIQHRLSEPPLISGYCTILRNTMKAVKSLLSSAMNIFPGRCDEVRHRATCAVSLAPAEKHGDRSVERYGENAGNAGAVSLPN